MEKLAKTLLLALGAMTLGACATGLQGAEQDESSEGALTPAPVFNGDPANHAIFGADVSVWETPLAQAEMDCFWASGVRHVIVGTQDEGVAREQLAMAVSRGMTVNAYVYLYWNTDLTAQVNQAFTFVQGFPIGRMWLDIEANPGSLKSSAVIADINQALTACQAQGVVPCGIYTGPGFWTSYVSNTTAFDGTMLWWAEYDSLTSLSSWSSEHFGGWTSPVGKQWASKPLCGIGGVDWDTIQVSATPTVTVDRSTPTDTGVVPPAPGGLFPSNGYAYPYSAGSQDNYAKIMSATIPLATSYQLDVERWSGKAWMPYYTWSSPDAFVKFSPSVPNEAYHFRVRAQNVHGWGPWSDWSWFVYGKYTGATPTEPSAPDSGVAPTPSPAPDAGHAPSPSPAPDAGTTPSPSPAVDAGHSSDSGSTPKSTPDAASGGPTGLSPDGNEVFTTPNVTLTCSPVAGATEYQFAIQYQSASGYEPYYTYSTSGASVTFYPQDREHRLSLAGPRRGGRSLRRMVSLRHVPVRVTERARSALHDMLAEPTRAGELARPPRR